MCAEMARNSGAAARIRAAGYDVKHVYRAWGPDEADLRWSGGRRCEVAIFLDNAGSPLTARLMEGAVLVDEGW